MSSTAVKPLHFQVREKILDRIRSGEFPPGARLPTEIDLSSEYGVSRATIRQALDHIEREEIIERHRRVGAIVRSEKIKPELMRLTSFSEVMLSRGMTPETRTLKVELIEAPPRVRSGFGAGAEKAWLIVRLCLADGEPIGLHRLHVPTSFVFSPEDLLGMQSFYQMMAKRFDIRPTSATETLTATVATAAEAKALLISAGAPLLNIWRTTYDQDTRAFEVVQMLYVAARYEYQFKLYP